MGSFAHYCGTPLPYYTKLEYNNYKSAMALTLSSFESLMILTP